MRIFNLDIKKQSSVPSPADILLSKLSRADRARVKKVAVDLMLQTQALTKHDVADWRTAWQLAINVERPVRQRLYAIYTDALVDLHLTGCIEQRRGMVMQKAFRLCDKAGKENTEVSELFEAGWFKDFMRLSLDSRYWGHSLIEFGDVIEIEGIKRFAHARLIPRHHVIPEYGVVVKEASDEPQKGVDYRSGPLAKWCIEAGESHDLGLLLKAAPQAISKRHMIAFWDQFGEVFGMPIRVAKTSTRDSKEVDKIERNLKDMGAAGSGVFPEGTTIEFVESTRGDAFNVYDKRIERANSEISKGIIGQTMTIENGASHSQSEVHLEVLRNLIAADADFLRDIINGKLLPLMFQHGFPVQGLLFKWDESIDYKPTEMQLIEQMVLNSYEVDPVYFAEKYNIPITGKREHIQPQLARGGFFD
jgi:hypothetical protein